MYRKISKTQILVNNKYFGIVDYYKTDYNLINKDKINLNLTKH